MPAAWTHADSLRFRVGSAEIDSLRAVGTISGVVVRFASARNGPGVGALRHDAAGLHWRPPGSEEFGPATAIAGDGAYLVEDRADPGRYVRVDVHADYLRLGDEATVYLDDRWNNGMGHDDVTAGEAQSGDVTTYAITLENVSADGKILGGLRVWLDAASTALAIGDDGATWSAPTDEQAALPLGDLGPGQTTTLYVRRTIDPGADPDPDVLAHLHASFSI